MEARYSRNDDKKIPEAKLRDWEEKEIEKSK